MKTKAEISCSAATARTHVGRYRYLIIAVIWITFFFGGFDRAAISLLIADHDFLWDMGLEGRPERQGLLMTFLLLPYALSNILLGPAADRWGSRKVLTVMTILWSVSAFWMGLIGSYCLMLIGRVARGIAEGPLFPAANRYIRYWIPTSERGGANAVWTSGNRVGMALAVPFLTLVIGIWGWRSALFLQGVFILILLVPAIWFLTADTPADMVGMEGGERDYITEGRATETARNAGKQGDLASLLHNYRFWLMVLYHFSVLATFSGLITWLPKYLRDERGLEVSQMVLFASLPSLGSFLSSLVFGFLSDRIGHRATLCTISLAGASISIGFAALTASPIMSAWLIVLGMTLWGMATPIYYAIMQHIVPASIMATGIGIDNGLANFGAAMAPAVIGFLIAATGSYLAGLLFLSGLGFIGVAGVAVLAVQKY